MVEDTNHKGSIVIETNTKFIIKPLLK